MRRRSSRRKKNRIKLIPVVILIFAAAVMFLADKRLRPIIQKNGLYQAKVASVREINQCIYDTLKECGYDYGSFCRITALTDGQTAYVETNAAELSAFKALVTDRLQERMNEMPSDGYGINIGNLSGMEYFYGRGYKLPIKIRPRGRVETRLMSSFSSAGINQTRHCIILEVDAQATAFIPGYSATADIKDAFILAETIIVGKVPDAYTQVSDLSSPEGDLMGVIEDFGAHNSTPEYISQ